MSDTSRRIAVDGLFGNTRGSGERGDGGKRGMTGHATTSCERAGSERDGSVLAGMSALSAAAQCVLLILAGMPGASMPMERLSAVTGWRRTEGDGALVECSERLAEAVKELQGAGKAYVEAGVITLGKREKKAEAPRLIAPVVRMPVKTAPAAETKTEQRDELSLRIDAYFKGHGKLIWSSVEEKAFRALIDESEWECATHVVEKYAGKSPTPCQDALAELREKPLPDGLAAVWKAAPAKARERSSKKQCLAVWKSQKMESMSGKVLAALQVWKKSEKWTKDNGNYVEGLHRWLAGEKWRELPEGVEAPSGQAPSRRPVQAVELYGEV